MDSSDEADYEFFDCVSDEEDAPEMILNEDDMREFENQKYRELSKYIDTQIPDAELSIDDFVLI